MNLRRTTTALLAGALSLSLIAAGEPAVPRGTASTSLTAVDLSVSGVADLVAVDLGSFASTDSDAARNVLGNGSPLGWVGITPLQVAGQALGAVEASSNGDSNVNAELVQWSDPSGLLSASVNPVGLTATASATEALGTAQAATASIDMLGEAIGLSLNTTGVASSVNQTASTAVQGLRVEGLDVQLGDLVPLEVLSLLPIDVLIELLEQLPVGAPDIEAIVDITLNAVGDVEDAAEAITAAGEQLATDLVALADANQVLADAQAVLTAAQNAETTAQNTLTAAQSALTGAQADLSGLTAANMADYAADCGLAVLGLQLSAVTTCLEQAVADAQAAVDAAQTALTNATAAVTAALAGVETAQAAVDALVIAINTTVDALQDLINDLVVTLGDLVDALTTLEGSLGDVVAALADGDILSVGAIDIGVVAKATDTVAGSTATVGCNAVPVAVLGLNVATPDCSNPLTTVGSVADTITGALQGLLTTLPVAADVLPAASIQVFPTVSENVAQDGDYVTSTANVVALDLSLGSVTIDPANVVSGLLDTLAAQVDALVAAAIPADGDVAGLGLDPAITTALADARGMLPQVSDLQTLLDDVLALLPDGLSLPTLETPALDLVVDPTSTASFASGAAPAPAPSPAPAPAPDGDPSLPATGGGLALLGLMSLGGAVALRRRR